MNRIFSFLFNWIDFLIHIYIHITATINAVIFVAKKSSITKVTTAQELILNRRRNNKSAVTATATIKTRCVNKKVYQPSHRSTLRRNNCRPFKKIPNEILIAIFEFMNQGDLYHCSTVTKHWNKLTTTILWKSPIPNQPIISCLPFDKKNKINHEYRFPLHLSRYGHAVKSLDLTQISSHVTDCTIRHIVHSCPHMTSLNLSNCKLITNEGLRYLTGYSNSNIKVLVLQNCRQITDIGLSYLKETCHSLETLHLGGCNRISDNGIIGLVTASGSTIRRINLSDCNRVTGSTIHAISRLCGPRLEWLDIARTKIIKHSDLEYLITHCPNISRLNVSMKKPKSLQELRNQLSFTTRQLFELYDDNTLVTGSRMDSLLLLEEEENNNNMIMMEEDNNPLNELIDLLNQFNIQPDLTSGSAQHQQYLIEQQEQRKKDSVSNQTIELIAINLKKLQHLNLSYWNCLDDKAIHMLSIHSHSLTYLNLIGCESVTKKVLRYLSDLCEKKSTCITLSDLMISPTNNNNNSSWVYSATATSTSLDSSLSKERTKHYGGSNNNNMVVMMKSKA